MILLLAKKALTDFVTASFCHKINGRITFEIVATLTATKCTKGTQIKIYRCFDDDKLHGDLDSHKLRYGLNTNFPLLYIHHFIFLTFLHFSVISKTLRGAHSKISSQPLGKTQMG